MLALPAVRRKHLPQSFRHLAAACPEMGGCVTASHADAKLEISSGATPDAFAALAEKKINIALTPRAIRYKEAQPCVAAFGQRPTEVKVGVNGVAIYVHPDNPVKVLMYEELEGIFTGKHQGWKKLGGKDAPIVAFGLNTNTAAGELFTEEVLAGKALAGGVQLVTEAEVLKRVAAEPNSIGFAPLAEATGVRL